RTHFVEYDRHACLRHLPCCFRSGQTAADDVNGLDCHAAHLIRCSVECNVRGGVAHKRQHPPGEEVRRVSLGWSIKGGGEDRPIVVAREEVGFDETFAL